MSASTAAQSGSEHVQRPPTSDQSNEAADGLPILTKADRSANSGDNLVLPGIGAPVVQKSGLPTEGRRGNWREIALPLTIRERVIMDVTAVIKDKLDWERKVFDEAIVAKWRSEALAGNEIVQSKDRSNDGVAGEDEQAEQPESKSAISPPRQRVVTEVLFQYCIDELRDQAADSQANGFTEVLDANAAVYISDTAVSQETKIALQSGVGPLEDIPDFQKDWHPGSNGKVLDLVHPSLFPLMYGTSNFLAEGNVPLENCANYTGLEETVPAVDLSAYEWEPHEYSFQYQWLPCDVSVNAAGDASITSYINNLHPENHRELYSTIEQVITKAVPLWKMAVRSTLYRYERPRLIVQGDGYDHDAAELFEEEMRQSWIKRNQGQSGVSSGTESADDDDDDDEEDEKGDERDDTDDDCEEEGVDDGEEEDDDDDDNDEEEDDDDDSDEGEECYKEKYIQVPDPDPYKSRERKATEEDASTFDATFSGNNLQVIVKLANIHLTPESPTYDGGSWHVEGLPNEHICASALYYYDSSNVTDSHLAFRESVNEHFLSYNEDPNRNFPRGPWYQQHRFHGLREIYGIDRTIEDIIGASQVLGKIHTREDRLLVFPNVLQHRVLPFSLADATQPGHRKILALFLVDPNITIPSTANIPPQQRDWWAQQINHNRALSKLPQELADRVYDAVRDFPISMERAKQEREELMEERKAQLVETEQRWKSYYYSFCEH